MAITKKSLLSNSASLTGTTRSAVAPAPIASGKMVPAVRLAPSRSKLAPSKSKLAPSKSKLAPSRSKLSPRMVLNNQ